MTPNLADQWLHEQLSAIREWQDEETVERACAGLDALEAAGAVPAAAASRWREAFAAHGGELAAGAELRERAARFLSGLLDLLPAEPEYDDDPVVRRFEAACDLYDAVGAADGAAWRERAGFPPIEEAELTRWSTELVQVIAGPEEVRGGHRLLVVLRFVEDVALVVDREAPEMEWAEWRLVDDIGTSYWYGGGLYDEHGAHVAFTPAIPARAGWIELSRDDDPDVVLRVRVD